MIYAAAAAAVMPYLPTGKAVLDPERVLHEAGIRLDMRVAELGIGAVGHFLLPAARLVGEKGHVYGVDILKPVLQANQSRMQLAGAANVTFVWGDIERPGGTKLPDSSMDLVSLVNILHATKRDQVIAEAARVLHTGGIALVVDWRPAGTALGPKAEKRLKEDQVIEAMNKAGLTLQKKFEAGPYHYGLVFLKP